LNKINDIIDIIIYDELNRWSEDTNNDNYEVYQPIKKEDITSIVAV
jgi:hypothetical protein